MRSIKKNLASVYLVNAVNGILGVIFVPLAVSLLGISGYGLFSIYAVIASYVALIDLGVTKNFVLLLASDSKASLRKDHLQTAFGLYIALSALLILLLPLLLFVIPKYIFSVPGQDIPALRWIIAFSVIEYVLTIPTAMTQMSCVADEKFERYSLFTFASGMYRYALLFIGIAVFGTPAAVVGLVVSRRFIDLFVSRWLMGALPWASFRPRFNLREMRTIVGRSSTLSVSQLFQSTVVSIGSIMINRYFGLSGLGMYRAAFDLANKIWFLSNGIGLVMFPRFVKLLAEKSHRERLFSRILWLLNASWVSYSLIAVAGMLAAARALNLVGLTQTQTIELFILLLLGVSWNAHANLSYEFLQAAGRFKQAAALSAISLVSMIFCFYLLLDQTGILAIGWAWIISQAIYAVMADALSAAISDLPVQINMLIFKSVVIAGAILVAVARLELAPQALQFAGIIIVLASGVWALIGYLQGTKKVPSEQYA